MFLSRIKVRPDIQELSQLSIVLQGNGYGIHQLLWKLFPSDGNRPFLFREEIAREQIPFQKGVKGQPVYYVLSSQQPSNSSPLFEIDSKRYSPKLAEGDRLSFKLRANPTVSRKIEGKKNSVRHDVVMDAQYHFLRELAELAGVSGNGKKSEVKKRVLEEWMHSKSDSVAEKLEQTIKKNERFRGAPIQQSKPANFFDVALKAYSDMALEEWLTRKAPENGFRIARDEGKDILQFQAEGYRWHHLNKKGKNAGFSSVDFEGVLNVVDPEIFVRKCLFGGIGPAKAFGCGLMLVRRA